MEVDACVETEIEADISDTGETDGSNVIAPTFRKGITFHWNLHLIICLD
jgi:hypothetical protein